MILHNSTKMELSAFASELFIYSLHDIAYDSIYNITIQRNQIETIEYVHKIHLNLINTSLISLILDNITTNKSMTTMAVDNYLPTGQFSQPPTKTYIFLKKNIILNI